MTLIDGGQPNPAQINDASVAASAEFPLHLAAEHFDFYMTFVHLGLRRWGHFSDRSLRDGTSGPNNCPGKFFRSPFFFSSSPSSSNLTTNHKDNEVALQVFQALQSPSTLPLRRPPCHRHSLGTKSTAEGRFSPRPPLCSVTAHRDFQTDLTDDKETQASSEPLSHDDDEEFDLIPRSTVESALYTSPQTVASLAIHRASSPTWCAPLHLSWSRRNGAKRPRRRLCRR